MVLVFGTAYAQRENHSSQVARNLDIFDEIGIRYTEEEAERLNNKLMSELVFEECRDMPKEGDSFVYCGARITVLSMKQNRIYRLRVKAEAPGEAEEGGGNK